MGGWAECPAVRTRERGPPSASAEIFIFLLSKKFLFEYSYKVFNNPFVIFKQELVWYIMWSLTNNQLAWLIISLKDKILWHLQTAASAPSRTLVIHPCSKRVHRILVDRNQTNLPANLVVWWYCTSLHQLALAFPHNSPAGSQPAN